jgi:hypothetical protein
MLTSFSSGDLGRHDQFAFEHGLSTDCAFLPEVSLFEKDRRAVDDLFAVATAVSGNHIQGWRFEQVFGYPSLFEPMGDEGNAVFLS